MPTHHKRHAPARTANGPAAPGQTAAPDTPPEASKPELPRRSGDGLRIADLKDMSIQKLTQIAKELNVAGATGMRSRS